MKTETSTEAFIPLGDLLMTEDPVWVWDVARRRILWANHPARIFWGAVSLEALQAKRFSSRSRIAARLSDLAARPDGVKEGTEELPIPSASGRKMVRCYLQGLQVAGGGAGFIIKALDADKVQNKNAKNNPSKPDIADHTTLQAIATRLDTVAKNRAAKETLFKDKLSQPIDPALMMLAVRELGHELGNPLNVIRGFASWIKEIAPPGHNQDKLRSYADNIAEAAELAMGVFTDFSAHFMDGQRHGTQEEAADIKLIAERCQSLVAPLAKDSGVRVYRRIEGKLPRLKIGNRGLQQILMNLLINAIRYHKTGQRIRITARRIKDGDVRLTVSDDGKGMTKKEISRALGRERKLPPANGGRSGLGLPLVRRIVENAGGQITIESQRSKGTQITVSFPPAIQETAYQQTISARLG